MPFRVCGATCVSESLVLCSSDRELYLPCCVPVHHFDSATMDCDQSQSQARQPRLSPYHLGGPDQRRTLPAGYYSTVVNLQVPRQQLVRMPCRVDHVS